jgi:hypothetical protein
MSFGILNQSGLSFDIPELVSFDSTKGVVCEENFSLFSDFWLNAEKFKFDLCNDEFFDEGRLSICYVKSCEGFEEYNPRMLGLQERFLMSERNKFEVILMFCEFLVRVVENLDVSSFLFCSLERL